MNLYPGARIHLEGTTRTVIACHRARHPTLPSFHRLYLAPNGSMWLDIPEACDQEVRLATSIACNRSLPRHNPPQTIIWRDRVYVLGFRKTYNFEPRQGEGDQQIMLTDYYPGETQDGQSQSQQQTTILHFEQSGDGWRACQMRQLRPSAVVVV